MRESAKKLKTKSYLLSFLICSVLTRKVLKACAELGVL